MGKLHAKTVRIVDRITENGLANLGGVFVIGNIFEYLIQKLIPSGGQKSGMVWEFFGKLYCFVNVSFLDSKLIFIVIGARFFALIEYYWVL